MLRTRKSHEVEILIVEDSAPQSRLLQCQLEEQGYRVHSVKDGTEALAYLDKNDPKLIISDVVMPEMDGFELCRRVKNGNGSASIPVLLLTALAEPEDIIRGLESGADNFVTKPYDRDHLISRVEYILVNEELRRQPASGMGVEIYFAGKKQFISSDRIQILDLLLATYEDSLRQKRKLEQLNLKLGEAFATIKTLKGIIPICAACKSIRDDEGYWQHLETYIREHSDADFTHGMCPECAEKLYAEHLAGKTDDSGTDVGSA